MNTEKIKSQLIDYNREFKQNSGHLKSLEVVFNYINFLRTEPYLRKTLSSLLEYVDEQMAKINEIVDDDEKIKEFDNIKIDLSDLSTLSQFPVFKEEIAIIQGMTNDEAFYSVMILIGVYLNALIMIASLMQGIKDKQKEGDQEKVNDLIDFAKDISFSLMPTKNMDGMKSKTITTAQYLDMSMEMVNKHIIDEIDAQSFLTNSKPKEAISFDKDKSILYIRDYKVQIARRSSLPIEHYILEAIFSKDSLGEGASYYEISEDFLKEEYDGQNDWNKFRHACEKINQKISIATNNKINDFLYIKTGAKGWCEIRKEYL